MTLTLPDSVPYAISIQFPQRPITNKKYNKDTYYNLNILNYKFEV